jgi:hypothetical protein
MCAAQSTEKQRTRVIDQEQSMAFFEMPLEIPDGWWVWTRRGRWQATRQHPFTYAEARTGAVRTVEGDDLVDLCRLIAEQESSATLTDL